MATKFNCDCASGLGRPGVWYPEGTSPSASSSCDCCPSTTCPNSPSRPTPPSDDCCDKLPMSTGVILSKVSNLVFNGQSAVKAVLNGNVVWEYFVPELEIPNVPMVPSEPGEPSIGYIELSHLGEPVDGTPEEIEIKSNTGWRIVEV